jgi:hypothetical protein
VADIVIWRSSSFTCARPIEIRSRKTSERRISDLDPLVGVDDALAPGGVEIGERLFGDGFQRGLPRGLQILNATARSDEHVTGFRQVRFVAERAVPRNNLGVSASDRILSAAAIIQLILPPVPGSM